MTHFVADHLSSLVKGAEAVLGQHEFLGEAVGFIIGEIFSLPEPHPDCFATGDLLEEERQVTHQFPLAVGPVADAQKLDSGFPSLIRIVLRAVMLSKTATKCSCSGLYTEMESQLLSGSKLISNLSGFPVDATRP